MLNYIYSVFRRSNADSKNNFISSSFLKFVILAMFSYIIFIIVILLLLENLIFEYGNTAFELMIAFISAFILVYPLVYSIIPGYKYLESVQKYTILEATFISCLIAFSPIAVMLILIRFL